MFTKCNYIGNNTNTPTDYLGHYKMMNTGMYTYLPNNTYYSLYQMFRKNCTNWL